MWWIQRGRRLSWRELCWEIERDLLGWELPPLSVAFDEEPIARDDPDAWCIRCGSSVGRGEARDGCGECRGARSRGPVGTVIRIGEYHGALARRVLQVKHARWHEMAGALGELLADQVRDVWRGARAAEPLPDAVVAVPMPWLRRWLRGIDHSAEIARGVARGLGIPLWRPLRQRAGGTQVGRSRTEREQARHRFGRRRTIVWRRQLGVPKHVLLVDDVRTTGATMDEVARELRRLGVLVVSAAVVAVAPSPRRKARGGASEAAVEELSGASNSFT